MIRNIYLLATHFVDDGIIQKYHSLQRGTGEKEKVVLLLHDEENNIEVPETIEVYRFHYETINNLGYTAIEETLIPGSNHFALLQFYKENPGYDYYWNIEYDVEFTGEWNLLFQTFSEIPADLLASHIKRYADDPSWYWWYTFKMQERDIPTSRYIRSFNPIYRISNKGLELVDQLLSEGNKGHHEVFIPTVLNHYAYRLVDFGGKGEFVLPGEENNFYLAPSSEREEKLREGTMLFRPAFEKEEIREYKNKLYHPVKIKWQ